MFELGARHAWALALGALALLPAAAAATTTVSYSETTGVLIQGDAAGETVMINTITGPDRIVVESIGNSEFPVANLVAASGCVEADPNRITCQLTGAKVVTANLGDGGDRYFGPGSPPVVVHQFIDGQGGNDQVSGAVGADLVRGGPGDDRVSAGPEPAGQGANDTVEGGDGNDRLGGDLGGTNTLRGQGGDDRFVAGFDSTFSADLVDGGPGTDTADYGVRTQPVSLTASTLATPTPNDGFQGEGDDLDNIETLIGGTANDTLEHSGQILRGAGTKGAVTRALNGNRGEDTLRAVGSVRVAHDGGLGQDTVTGGPLNDTIFSREGEVDTITCGGGIDTLTSDLVDSVAAGCESVNEGEKREGAHVVFRSRSVAVDEDGSLSVRLSCPRSLRSGCRGALAARVDRRGSRFGGARRYSLDRGDSATIEVELPAAQTSAARRRNARVALRSVERGVHGKDRTTLRSLPARRG